MRKEKKPKAIHRPKCVRLINIGAKLEVVMAKEVVDRLGTHKLNSMSLIAVGVV